jgi:hypothetical protein
LVLNPRGLLRIWAFGTLRLLIKKIVFFSFWWFSLILSSSVLVGGDIEYKNAGKVKRDLGSGVRAVLGLGLRGCFGT